MRIYPRIQDLLPNDLFWCLVYDCSMSCRVNTLPSSYRQPLHTVFDFHALFPRHVCNEGRDVSASSAAVVSRGPGSQSVFPLRPHFAATHVVCLQHIRSAAQTDCESAWSQGFALNTRWTLQFNYKDQISLPAIITTSAAPTPVNRTCSPLRRCHSVHRNRHFHSSPGACSRADPSTGGREASPGGVNAAGRSSTSSTTWLVQGEVYGYLNEVQCDVNVLPTKPDSTEPSVWPIIMADSKDTLYVIIALQLALQFLF